MKVEIIAAPLQSTIPTLACPIHHRPLAGARQSSMPRGHRWHHNSTGPTAGPQWCGRERQLLWERPLATPRSRDISAAAPSAQNPELRHRCPWDERGSFHGTVHCPTRTPVNAASIVTVNQLCAPATCNKTMLRTSLIPGRIITAVLRTLVAAHVQPRCTHTSPPDSFVRDCSRRRRVTCKHLLGRINAVDRLELRKATSKTGVLCRQQMSIRAQVKLL